MTSPFNYSVGNLFHASGLFWHPLKKIENVFRRYRKRPAVWNGLRRLISKSLKLISNLSPYSEAVNFTNNFWSFIHTQKVHFRVNVILICFRSICAKCHENPRKHSDKFLISRCISLAFQVAKNTNLRNCRPEVLYKKLFLISQNLQEKTCVRVRKTPAHEKEIPIQVFNGNF